MNSLQTQKQVLTYFAAVLCLLSLFTVPILVVVIRAHMKAQRILFTVRSLFSPFNSTLLGLGISIAGIYANTSISLSGYLNSHNEAIVEDLNVVWVSTFSTCYVVYSYNRGISIIQIYLSSMERVIKWLAILIPLTLLLCIIPQVAASILRDHQDIASHLVTASYVLNVTGSVLAIIFDAILLTAFARGSKSMQLETGITNDARRLLIISNYGTWAIVVYLFSVAAFIFAAVTADSFSRNPLAVTAQTLMFAVYLILIAMKVALQQEKRQATANMREFQNKVRTQESTGPSKHDEQIK
ncbi:hypothetical protein BC830DRAFT_1158757 [Chytriomyces sp. MP71]|nr:hypothetical protein BC830DRAFT_1158757 [Chytriomyces sp. MP71]